MRLFVAINFPEEVKDRLTTAIGTLEAQTLQGKFTLRENLHLTLVFLGETNRLKEVKQAMSTVNFTDFNLKIGGLGRFTRSGGDIYWAGVGKSAELGALQAQLTSALTKVGFTLDDRTYSPHLTLGREVLLKPDFDETAIEKSIDTIDFPVSSFDLMCSERIWGKLTYTELFSVKLNRERT